MRHDLDDLCDRIDAAVFTGDTLWDLNGDAPEFKEYIRRWYNEMLSVEAAQAEDDEEQHNNEDE